MDPQPSTSQEVELENVLEKTDKKTDERGNFRKRRRCQHCPQSFYKNSDVVRHASEHVKSIHYCTICGMRFSDLKTAIRHLIKKKNKNDMPCSMCHQQLPGAAELEKHIRQHDQRNEPLVCKCCGITFQTRSELAKHNKEVYEECIYYCTTCGERFKYPTRLMHHMAIHDRKYRYCKFCPRSFYTQVNLVYHLEVVHGYYDLTSGIDPHSTMKSMSLE